MGFDISRSTFNSWNDYLGVVMQQGRVHLDSDWNELIDEFFRRIQTGALDAIGLAGVPSTTPQAFQIGSYTDQSGTTHLTIGVGRIYLGGLLAENHGSRTGTPIWDAALAEWTGDPTLAALWDPVLAGTWEPALAEWTGSQGVPLDYTSQPYLPGATLPTSRGPFLVYLDVWQRDVSYLIDPNLVDKAVGVDTTGRRQTVWQVKLLDVSAVTGGVDPSTPDSTIIAANPIWANVVLPSQSQLTVPPTGHTGQENQLYRVQIHQGGTAAAAPVTSYPLPPGTASFKWSRENASVTTSVIAITPVTNSAGNTVSQLTVQSLGRDQVLGFKPGDWIEIIDNYLELNPSQTTGQAQAGELHQIVSVNPAALTLTLDTAVTAIFPVTNGPLDPTRYTRIVRWDQAGTVYESDGQTVWTDLTGSGVASTPAPGIPVPLQGTPVLLENGIAVTFSLPQANGSPLAFRTGDYWTFAARAADGSVEPLNNAPPAGIRHHSCRLGIFSASTTSDFRTVFQTAANPAIQVLGLILVGSGAPLVQDGNFTAQSLTNGIGVVCNVPIAINPKINTVAFDINQTQPPWQIAAPWNSTTLYTPGEVVSNDGYYYYCIASNINQSPSNASFWIPEQFNCPFFTVTVDVPTSVGPPAGTFTPQALSASVSVSNNTLVWTPTPTALSALENEFSASSVAPPPFLARLRVKGNCITAVNNPNMYLNGAGDGRSFADYETWFWLTAQPPISLSQSSLSFGAVMLTTTSAAQAITLTNNNTTAVNPSPTLGGTNSADFTITSNTCAASVPAGGNCSFSVTFTPVAVGQRTAQVNISGSTDTVVLLGVGAQPQASASPSSLPPFGNILLTDSSSQIVTLANTSSGVSQWPLTVSSIAIQPTGTEPGSGDFSQTNSCIPPGGNGVLQPGAQCTITVQFTPSATGARSAQLVITHNAPGSPISIGLSGSGIKAKDTKEKEKEIIKDRKDAKEVEKAVVEKAVVVESVARTNAGGSAAAATETVPAGTAAAGDESGTRKAFISPEERPPLKPPT
jgi:hypothetical protein